MKSGGSSGGAPTMPNPKGNVAPYGQSTPFNPMFTSYLNEDSSQVNTLQNQPRQELGAPTPLLAQQQAAPMVASDASGGSGGSGGMGSSERKFLAQLIARAEMDKLMKQINKESAGGGSQASGSFSGSAFGGGGASGGLY